MIISLFHLLHHYGIVKIPPVFYYFSTRMILGAITSLLFVFIVGPFFIRKLYALKIGQIVRSKSQCPLSPLVAELHAKKKDTPTMGGILIIFSLLCTLFLWMDLRSFYTWFLLLSTLTFGIFGVIDDYLKLKYKNTKGLSGKTRLIWQFVITGFFVFYIFSPLGVNLNNRLGLTSPVAKTQFYERDEITHKKVIKQKTLKMREYLSQLYVPFYKKPWIVFEGMFRIILALFFMIVIVGSINAVNLTDGLDGLAVGLSMMVAIVLGAVAFLSNHIDLARYLNILYIEGSGEIGVFLFALSGACLGFLWYNGYPAQVFLGDTGSVTLGSIIGVSAILLRREFLLALAGGIFVAEAMSVILQVLSYKYRNKKRIFLCSPLHHHFECKGWAEPKIVLRFWIIGLFLAIVAIGSLKFQ